jgi:hypothetical protein
LSAARLNEIEALAMVLREAPALAEIEIRTGDLSVRLRRGDPMFRAASVSAAGATSGTASSGSSQTSRSAASGASSSDTLVSNNGAANAPAGAAWPAAGASVTHNHGRLAAPDSATALLSPCCRRRETAARP